MAPFGPDKQIKINNLIYKPLQKHLLSDSDPDISLSLSSSEHRIFMFLLENQQSVTAKHDLENIGWGGRPVSSSALVVALCSLRKKLSYCDTIEIRNISGEGYILHVKNRKRSKNQTRISPRIAKMFTYKATLKGCITLSILVLIFILINVWALKANFECITFGKSIYCYVGAPNNEDIRKAFNSSKKRLFFYSPSPSSGSVHEIY